VLLTGCFVDAGALDATAPALVEVEAPADLLIAAGETQRFTFTYDERVQAAQAFLVPAEGEALELDVELPEDERAAVAVVTAPAGAADGSYAVEVRAEDADGNVSVDRAEEAVRLDQTPPTLVAARMALTPADGNPLAFVLGVTDGTDISMEVELDEPAGAGEVIVQLTDEQVAFTLEDITGAVARATVTWDEREDVFQGIAQTTLRMEDLAGNALEVSGSTWTFVAGAERADIDGLIVLKPSALVGPPDLVYVRDPVRSRAALVAPGGEDLDPPQMPTGAIALANDAPVARLRIAADPDGLLLIEELSFRFNAQTAQSGLRFDPTFITEIYVSAIDVAGNATPFVQVPAALFIARVDPTQQLVAAGAFVEGDVLFPPDERRLGVEAPDAADALLSQAANADVWREAEANGVFPDGGACVRVVEDRSRAVLVAITPDMDVFEFDGDAWREIEPGPGPVPTPRQCPAVTYDAHGGRVLVHGGVGSAGAEDDLWSWSGGAWTPIVATSCVEGPPGPSLAVCPTGRSHHAQAYDTRRSMWWVHGGGDRILAGFLIEGWVSLASIIPDRADHAMVYDEDRDVLVLAGGFDDQGVVNDTIVEVDISNGAAVTDRGALGLPGEVQGVWDPIRRRVIFIGNDGGTLSMRAWDGANLVEVVADNEPGTRSLPGFAHHLLSDTFVLHGGTLAGLDIPFSSFLQSDFDDEYRWRDVVGAGTTRPPRRIFGAASHDPTRGLTVLLGGHGPDTGFVLPDPNPWVFDGYGWRTLGNLGARTGAAGLFIPGTGHLFFGGRDAANNFNDLVGFDAATLTPSVVVLGGTPPSERSQTAAAFDFDLNTAVVFGGTTGLQLDLFAPGSATLLGDTFEIGDPGTGFEWSTITPTTSPSPRANAAMSWSPAEGLVVLYGGVTGDGNGGVVVNDETWLYDVGTREWSQASPATSPPARQAATLALDAVRGRLALMGGMDADGGALNDVWEWTGDNWIEVTSTPRALAGAAGVGDRRGRVMTIGGGDAISSTSAIFRREPAAPSRPSFIAFTSLASALVPIESLTSLELRAQCTGGSEGAPGAELAVWTVGGPDRLGAGGWRVVDDHAGVNIDDLRFEVNDAADFVPILHREGAIIAWQCRPLAPSDRPGAAVVVAREGELRAGYTPPPPDEP
jgi:hypothetical protein